MNLRIPLRYAGWMARDAAIRPGLACLVIAALFAFIATRVPTRFTEATARDFLVRTVSQFDWLVVLIATAGMVSWDRASGYYRSLFSQPVNPGLYYLQRWVIAGVAVALFVPLTSLGIFSVSGYLTYSGPLMEKLLLKYLLLGGLTFTLSTVVRVDWLIAFLIQILQSVLYGLDQAGAPISGFTRALAHALPPFQFTSTRTAFFSSVGYASTADLTHALLYGLGLLMLGFAVLTLRPMGSGGRA